MGPVRMSSFTNLAALVSLQGTPMGFEQKPITTSGRISRKMAPPTLVLLLPGRDSKPPPGSPSRPKPADDQDLGIC